MDTVKRYFYFQFLESGNWILFRISFAFMMMIIIMIIIFIFTIIIIIIILLYNIYSHW